MSEFVPIHNSYGQVELWLYGSRLVDLGGQSVGFVYGEHVYDYNGVHRGRFNGGVIRDHYGAVVGFVPNATDLNVLKPLLGLRPLAPLLTLEPLRPLRSLAPLAPLRQMVWSQWGPLALFDL